MGRFGCGRRPVGGSWPRCRATPARSAAWHCAGMDSSWRAAALAVLCRCGGRRWDALRAHTGTVWGVALSSEGRLLAGGRKDGPVRLWEAPGGQQMATLEGHTGGVWGVALSADGRLLASGGLDGTVRLWDP